METLKPNNLPSCQPFNALGVAGQAGSRMNRRTRHWSYTPTTPIPAKSAIGATSRHNPMIDRQKFIAWLDLPKGDAVKLTNRNRQTLATITTFEGQTYHYRVEQTPGSFTLSDAGASFIISDRNGSRDAGEYIEAHVDATVADEVAQRNDNLTGELRDQFGLDADHADAIAQWHCQRCRQASTASRAKDLALLIEVLLTRPNPKLAGAGMSYAAGLDSINGKTMTETARELGVTRAAVSKESNFWSDTLGLPRSRYMKSARARRAYRTAQLNRVKRGR